MTGKMKAVRIVASQKDVLARLELQEVDIPSYGDDEILVKVAATSICGSDLHYYLAEFQARKVPLTLGHQYVGEVAAIGKSVTHIKVGDRICAELKIGACGHCRLCHAGMGHLCRDKISSGINIDGSYANYISMKAILAHPLPDNVPWLSACMIEPSAVAITGLQRRPVKPDDFVVVFGAGPIGLITVQLCKNAGARKVIVAAGRNKMRAKKAKEFGADYVIADPDADVGKIIMEMTDGNGADVCYDCAGTEGALNNAISSCGHNGEICIVGVPSGVYSLNMRYVVHNAINMYSSFSSSSTSWDIAVSMLSRGVLDLGSLVTAQFPLEQYDDAFQMLKNKQAIAVAITSNGPV